MGLTVGKYEIQAIKAGNINVEAVYLGTELIWPVTSSINLEELILALSCYSFGHWEDILPWLDTLFWRDNIEQQ